MTVALCEATEEKIMSKIWGLFFVATPAENTQQTQWEKTDYVNETIVECLRIKIQISGRFFFTNFDVQFKMYTGKIARKYIKLKQLFWLNYTKTFFICLAICYNAASNKFLSPRTSKSINNRVSELCAVNIFVAANICFCDIMTTVKNELHAQDKRLVPW